MITTSTAWDAAYASPVIYSRIAGKITLKNGKEFDIDEHNIVPNTFGISNKCVNGSLFEYGAVYSGELNVTVKMKADRYALFDAVITPFYYMRLANGTEESISLGKWIVSDPIRTKRVVAFKCYDNMILFEDDVEENTSGSAYDLLKWCCEKCGVELANTAEEVAGFVNGTDTYFVNPETVGTYRDLIGYIAKLTCTFATIDRDGRLRLTHFGKSSGKTIISKKVTQSNISDFKSYFAGAKARFIAEENYAPYEYAEEGNDGLTLDMGDIPIVQGSVQYKHQIMQNIFDGDLKLINYTPCEISIVPDVALELGDMVTIENANGEGTEVTTLITSISFTHHAVQKIKSVGGNPRLTVKTKSQKTTSSLEGQLASQSLLVYRYTNAQDYSLAAADKRIILMRFNSTSASTILFNATILIDVAAGQVTVEATSADGSSGSTVSFSMDGKAELTLTYDFNNSKITDHVPIETLGSGKHVVTIHNSFTVEDNAVNRLVLYANITGGTAEIPMGWITASVLGKGLSAKVVEWDGTLEIEEKFTPVTIGTSGVKIGKMQDSVSTEMQAPAASMFTETFHGITIGVNQIRISNMVGSIVTKEVIKTWTISADYKLRSQFNEEYVSTSNSVYKLNKNYEYLFEEQTIDAGRMEAVTLDLTQYTAESVVVDG